MDVRRILNRIRETVRQSRYLVPLGAALGAQREALAPVVAAIADPDSDPDEVRMRIHQLHAAGRIDRVMMLSALGVLAASPLVKDYSEAARLAGQQELVALDAEGDLRQRYLASADRHRGVLAYLLGYYEIALDWFAQALEREPSAENLGNVLAAMIRLGQIEEATDLRDRVATIYPDDVLDALARRIEADDDLVRLRQEPDA
ncbi:MAG: hypothetical protein AAF211_16710 [Myxococcota bacterium]